MPESVIRQTQSKLFAFPWKHKRDRIKRQVLVRPLSKGGLGFPCFRTAIKALRLSYIGRLLNDTDDIWKAIPNHYFSKDGGLLLTGCRHSDRRLINWAGVFWGGHLPLSSGFDSANTVSINFRFFPDDYLRLPVPVMTSYRRYVTILSRKVNKTEGCNIAPTTLLLLCQRSLLIRHRQTAVTLVVAV